MNTATVTMIVRPRGALRVESHTRPHPICHSRRVALAATRRGPSASTTDRLRLRQSADLPTHEPKRSAIGSAQLTGKIWIADFIYTTCPGPCPMISTRMGELQKPLEKTDVHLVSFSVDPGKDTPDVLRKYADNFHAIQSAGLSLRERNRRSTNCRTTDSSSRFPIGARLRACQSTARAWCSSIDMVKSAAITTRSARCDHGTGRRHEPSAEGTTQVKGSSLERANAQRSTLNVQRSNVQFRRACPLNVDDGR